jgi:hypothetical protein
LFNSSSTNLTANTSYWVRVTRATSSGDVIFYTSSDGVTWNQFGTTQTNTSGSLFGGAAELEIGTRTNGGLDAFWGNIYRVTISNSISGSPVVDFNPASFSPSTSQTQWTSTTGEVWTINKSTGTTGYKGELVYRSMLQGDGVNDNLTISSIASTQPYTEYIVQERLGTGGIVSKLTANALSNNATVYSLNNGSALSFSNNSKLIQLITTRNNGASSGVAANNGTETTGNSGAGNGTDLTLVGGNYGIETYIQSNANDNSTVRASMYNILKQMNSNAF